MTTCRTREESRGCFTPRQPDQAVRRWGHTLARSGWRRILDVGCGGGRHVIYLLGLGLSVTAGDQSTLALSDTRRWLERERLSATLVQLEMTALPFQSETFDAALSVNVLHHAQPAAARAAVREMWRVLRPGGLFLAVLAGPGDCQCLLERPLASAGGRLECAPAPPGRAALCDEHDLYGLFSGFRILDTQRQSLSQPGGTAPPCWRGVNWRVWAERPYA